MSRQRRNRQSAAKVQRAPASPQEWWKAAALLVIAVIVYLPAIRGGFVWDDRVFITSNPQMHGPVTDLWITAKPDYLPLTLTLYWIETALWGFNAPAFHLVNVLLHAAVGLAFWRLLKRLQVGGAYLAAVLFTLHPVAVESVAWIAETKNMLCLLLALISTHLFVDAVESGKSSRYGLALLAFVFAMCAKSAVIMLPVALLAILWWRAGTISTRQFLRILPFFAVSAIFAVVTIHFQNKVIGAETVPLHGLAARSANAVKALCFYASKIAWPHPLTFFYPKWHARFDLLTIALSLFLVAMAAALWVLRNRWGRGPLAAALIFAVLLFPVLGFFNMAWMEFAPVADHYAYVAMPALLALVAAALARLQSTLRYVPVAAITVIALALGALTFLQARNYTGEETLWRATIAHNPNAWAAYNGLGDVYSRRGESDRAIANFVRAADLNPRYAAVRNNLGAVYETSGKIDEAIEQYRQAVAINPELIEPQFNLGRLLLRRHRPADAEAPLRHAAELLPGSPDVHLQLGTALLEQNRAPEAAGEFSHAIRLAPARADAHLSLALALRAMGRSEQAFAEYQVGTRLQQGAAAQ